MAALAQAAPIVLDTSSTGNMVGTGAPFGDFGTTDQSRLATVGEIFVAPTGAATFQSIAFDIRSSGAPAGPQTVDAYFATWSPGSPGPILGSVTGLVIPGGASFSRLVANFGSIAVTPGQQYIAYITTLTPGGQYPGMNPYLFEAGPIPPAPTPDVFGGEVVINFGKTFAELASGSNTWNTPFGRPLAFVATFETPVVPELSSRAAAMPLCWVGLGLLASSRRRRP